jgi:hypothetical protein
VFVVWLFVVLTGFRMIFVHEFDGIDSLKLGVRELIEATSTRTLTDAGPSVAEG